tara:strand:+ start:275 stop:454 length:180 start_codon:yes stop_codon:yes gene_type:complete
MVVVEVDKVEPMVLVDQVVVAMQEELYLLQTDVLTPEVVVLEEVDQVQEGKVELVVQVL